MLTYGDGVADININNLLKFIKIMAKLILTASRPPVRFGELSLNRNLSNHLKKNHRQAKVGLTQVFLFLIIKSLILLRMIRLC